VNDHPSLSREPRGTTARRGDQTLPGCVSLALAPGSGTYLVRWTVVTRGAGGAWGTSRRTPVTRDQLARADRDQVARALTRAIVRERCSDHCILFRNVGRAMRALLVEQDRVVPSSPLAPTCDGPFKALNTL
jgi:hypothetical protein